MANAPANSMSLILFLCLPIATTAGYQWDGSTWVPEEADMSNVSRISHDLLTSESKSDVGQAVSDEDNDYEYYDDEEGDDYYYDDYDDDYFDDDEESDNHRQLNIPWSGDSEPKTIGHSPGNGQKPSDYVSYNEYYEDDEYYDDGKNMSGFVNEPVNAIDTNAIDQLGLSKMDFVDTTPSSVMHESTDGWYTSTVFTIVDNEMQSERPHVEVTDGTFDDVLTNNDIGSWLSQQTPSMPKFITQPGTLAAILGGTIFGLLCAILCVMFAVFRMRRKQELHEDRLRFGGVSGQAGPSVEHLGTNQIHSQPNGDALHSLLRPSAPSASVHGNTLYGGVQSGNSLYGVAPKYNGSSIYEQRQPLFSAANSGNQLSYAQPPASRRLNDLYA